MIYELTDLEFKFAKLVGWARHAEAEKSGRKADWYDGSERDNHVDGAAVELLTAKILNVYYEPRINNFKGADVGHNIEARGTKADWYGVKVKDRDKDERVVIGFRKVDNKHYDLLGWIYAQAAKQKKWLKDPGKRGRYAYFVPQENLSPIESLPKDKKLKQEKK